MKTLFLLIAAAAALFAICLISTVLGAAVGWAVGLLFGDTILTFLSRVGVDTANLRMWQVGASLGFIGSFFKSTFNASKSNG